MELLADSFALPLAINSVAKEKTEKITMVGELARSYPEVHAAVVQILLASTEPLTLAHVQFVRDFVVQRNASDDKKGKIYMGLEGNKNY